MPADEYTFGRAAASFAPSCESSTSVPTLTTASTPASSAPSIAASGEISKRSKCVCESTNISSCPRKPATEGIIEPPEIERQRFSADEHLFALRSYEPVVDLVAPAPVLSRGPRRRPRWALAFRGVDPRPLDDLFEGQRLSGRATPNDEYDLAPDSFCEMLRRLPGRPSKDLLVQLRQLPADRYRCLHGQFPQRLHHPVRRLVDYESRGFTPYPVEDLPPFPALARQEAQEHHHVYRQPGGDERRYRRRGSRQHLYLHAGLDASPEQAVAWVGDERGAGVGDERHACGLGLRGQLRGETVLVVLMVDDQRSLYPEMGEQATRPACVLAGYQIRFAQSAESAEGDVLQVAYGGGNDYEGHAEYRPCINRERA